MKAIILNDTRRDAGHLGCESVMRAIEVLCASSGIEIVASFRNPRASMEPGFMDAVRSSDAVIVNGEGSMHHDMPNAMNLVQSAMVAKENGLRVHLVNSLWQSNPMLERHLDVFDSIAVRESFSAKEVEAAGFACTVVPDLSLYARKGEEQERRPKPCSFVYTDSVIPSVTKFLLSCAFRHGADFRYMVKHPGWRGFAKERLAGAAFMFRGARCGLLRDRHLDSFVVTGRFHAMCLAIKYGLPFLAVGSNSHKMEGTLADAGVDPSELMFAVNDARDLGERISALRGAWKSGEAFREYVERSRPLMEKTFANFAGC